MVEGVFCCFENVFWTLEKIFREFGIVGCEVVEGEGKGFFSLLDCFVKLVLVLSFNEVFEFFNVLVRVHGLFFLIVLLGLKLIFVVEHRGLDSF